MFAFVENGKLNGTGEGENLTEGVLNVEISEEVFNNIDRYMWNGEAVVENPNYEPDHSEEIAELKAYLESTDYVVIKIAEGVATSEEYAEVLAERVRARARINQLGGD